MALSYLGKPLMRRLVRLAQLYHEPIGPRRAPWVPRPRGRRVWR